jgi:autotransporter-associated beta strand protein
MFVRFLGAFLGIAIALVAHTQVLTISNAGQTGASGSNWSITGTTLTVTGTADVNVSVITDKLSTGALSIVGNSTTFSVFLQNALSSSTSNALTIGASNNSGNISLRGAVSLGGALTLIGGPVSVLEPLTLTGSAALNITSVNTVISATTSIGGSASIAASGNFILGTNITAGTGYPLTASGGFTKTGAGTSYLFSDLITSNAAVTIAGPIQIGNFNTSSTTTEIKSNGGNINLSGALSPFVGNGREYMALYYANLYDADGGSVSGSTTDIFLRFNAGAHNFVGLPGMSSSIAMQYLVAGGGGGGGNSWSGNYSGGGAGGGGVVDGNYTYNGSPIAILVGSGGGLNTNGSDSYLATVKCGGGGAGGNYNNSGGVSGNGGAGYAAGGGGGGAGANWGSGAVGGTGTVRNGGSGSGWGSVTNYGGSGGGTVGNGSGNNSGGAGLVSSITGTAVSYGAGAGANGTPVAKTGGGGGAIHYGTFQGANGVVILRFALPNAATLNALTPATSLHVNAAAGGIALGSTVSNLSLTLTSDGTTSIAGLITGSTSLTKAGSSTLTLSGNHTYTGGTTVNSGILKLNDTYANPGSGVIIGSLTVNQNGTVQLAGSPGALGWHATNRVTTININGGMLEAINGQQHIWNLDGGLHFNGGGTLRSNGGDSNSAATSYIEWGVGYVSVTNPTAPAIIAGRINLRSDINTLNGAASGGVISMVISDGSATNDLLVSAAITQTGAATITKTGGGKMTFTGVNNHTGTMTISAGVFQVGNEGTTGTISGGAIVNNASIVFNRSNDYTISNVISGTGTIEKLGAGALTLTGANTYTGATTVSQGVLKLGSTTALGTVAGITTITSGAALDLNGINYSTLEPLTLNGTGLSSGGAMTNSSATAGTFAGPITLASASLIKCSTGAITVSGTVNGAFALNVESTTAAYTQSGIVGATSAPTSYTINTGSGATIISANTTIAGPLTIDAGQISMNSTIASSLNNAGLTFRSQKFINHTGSTGLTLTTQGGPILMSANADDDTDNDITVNGYILFSYGLTINSNNGHITMGGGDALASGYALGTSAYPYEGLRVDGTLNISSGAGNIIMRGKSYGISTTSGAWGLGFWNLTSAVGNGTITSGTGTIYLDGFSQSTGGTYCAALFSNGPLTITSANTTADAIKLIGKGTGTGSDAWGIECESALNVYATADGGGITISTSQQVADNYDAVFRGETNILAKSGQIQLLGKQSNGVANGRIHNGGNFYLGSRANTPVPSSSSNITYQYDKFDFGSTLRYVATTGSVAIQPASNSFGVDFLSSWFTWNQNSQTMSGLTLGKTSNTAVITHQTNAITAAGPISFYGGTINLNNHLTTTNSGNISLHSNNAIGGLTAQRNVTAAGTFTYAPQGTSFGSAVSFPINNLNLTCAGLTIGKLNNLAGITIGAATAINGPITLHGGDLTLSAALSSTNTTTGDISLNGSTLSGGSLSVAEGRTLTLNLSSNTTYAGAISGANNNFNLVKSGSGALTLSHAAALSLQNATIQTGSLILPAGKQFTVAGALTNNGIFTLESGATFKQGTSVTGSGTYNIKQTIDNGAGSGATLTGRFWYMGSPLSCTRSSAFGAANDLNKVWTFSNGAYSNIADATLLSPTAGYVHRRSDASSTLTFSGQNLYAQDATLALSNNASAHAGWHLISNPYTAFLDWSQIVANSTGISNSYYIRSYNATGNDVNALISYNSTSGLTSNTSGFNLGATGSTSAQYIAPLQAFWVKVNPTPSSATAGQLNLQRAFTSHQTGTLKNTTVFPTLARVNLVDGARFDQLLVFMNQDMTNAVDQYDSEKMFVSGTPQIYTMAAGKKLVMNGLKNNKKKISVPLYLELPTSKVYELQLTEYILEDGIILLEDKQEGTIQDFTIHDTYAFYANSGVLSNRFVLHFFMPDATITAQGPSNSWVEDETSYTEGGSVQIAADSKGKVQISLDQPETDKAEGTVQATDANGRVVYSGALEGALTIFELNVPTGVYYLTVQTANQIEMKKVFIQE